jgi:hypothetical protein
MRLYRQAGWTYAHATRPPKSATEFIQERLLSPVSRLSREAGSDCSLRASRQVECREDRTIVDEWRAEGVVSSRLYQIIVNLACERPERADLRKPRTMLGHVARPLADWGGQRNGCFGRADGVSGRSFMSTDHVDRMTVQGGKRNDHFGAARFHSRPIVHTDFCGVPFQREQAARAAAINRRQLFERRSTSRALPISKYDPQRGTSRARGAELSGIGEW